MIVLPVYILVFIDGGHSDLDVSAVNTTYDIWEISDSMKRCFHSSCLALLVEVDISRHQSGERSILRMVLHTIDLHTKQITTDQLLHAKKLNATRTCRVVVSDPFRLLILMLSSTISTKSMISWRRNWYLSNTSNGRSAFLNISFSAIHALLHDFVDELIAMQPDQLAQTWSGRVDPE